METNNPTPNEDRPVGSPRAREISDFLAALRHRSQNPTGTDNADLVAWKSSLLERIAADSHDPEVHAVADNARAQLDETRGNKEGGR